jgi:DNA repair photolyase
MKSIQVKSIITPSKLPGSDYVINPYVGCIHGCYYCYAVFMRRFTNHAEAWGQFVDIKNNALAVMPKRPEKYAGKTITIGSVTDSYQPVEQKHQLTRKILEQLINYDSSFYIITKSDLVLRDIDLLKQFKDITIMLSFGFHEDKTKNLFEPRTCSIVRRLAALKILHENDIKTRMFVSPIFPYLTNWKTLVKVAKDFVPEIWFENLNLYPSIRYAVFSGLQKHDSGLIKKYRLIYGGESDYWRNEANEIQKFCQDLGILYKICFHGEKEK